MGFFSPPHPDDLPLQPRAPLAAAHEVLGRYIAATTLDSTHDLYGRDPKSKAVDRKLLEGTPEERLALIQAAFQRMMWLRRKSSGFSHEAWLDALDDGGATPELLE